MPSEVWNELRSVASLLSTEATSTKHERCPKITEYFKDKSVTIEIPSMSVWSLSKSSAKPLFAPTISTSVSKAILRNLIRTGNLYSSTKANVPKRINKLLKGKFTCPSAIPSPGEQESVLGEGGKIDHEAVAKKMSVLLTFEKREKEGSQADGKPDEESSKLDHVVERKKSKVNGDDISLVASTFAQNLKKSICKITDDHVIYYLSNLLAKSVKRNKGIIPYEAAKLLSHHSAIDSINTEDADNELAMKSFQESKGKKFKVKSYDEHEEDDKEGAGASTKLTGEGATDKNLEMKMKIEEDDDDDGMIKVGGKNYESEKDDTFSSKNAFVDHVAKIKNIHTNSPSLREMIGLNDDNHLQKLPSLETGVKKFTTTFAIIEDPERKFVEEEGEFSCAIKFNAILTLVILKHETTLHINEIGKITGSIDKDNCFKNLSLKLHIDSLSKSLAEIIKSSVENAVKSNITTSDIPNQRFKVEIAPVDKIIPAPKLMDDSTEDAQVSRKRRRSELDANDSSDSARNKKNPMASLLSMASIANSNSPGATLNGSMSTPMTNINGNMSIATEIVGQNNVARRGSGSMGAMFGQNGAQATNIQGLNLLMNVNHLNQQNMNPNQFNMNMNSNSMNVMNSMNTMNSMNSMQTLKSMSSMKSSNDNNSHSTNNDRYHHRNNSVSEAMEVARMAERRQNINRQSRVLALAAAETAKMREIKSAMETLRRSSAGRSTEVNSMAAAAEAVRLAETENKLDSLGSKDNSHSNHNRNTGSNNHNSFYSSLNQSDVQNSSTADLLRLLESRSSMVAQSSSQMNTDQSQRMDLEAAVNTLRRHSNIGGAPGANELSGILGSLGRDEGAGRRRSSYGGSALMENVLKALRRQSASLPRASEAGGSMAAAAEAVRLAEMDVMNSMRRRSSSSMAPCSSMAAAAEIVRQAELDAAMNSLRRRRSSAGSNSIAAAAEAVRLAEENNVHSSSNRNYKNRRSFIMSDAMMRDADDLSNAIHSATGVGNSAAAEATRLTDVEGNYSSLLHQNNSYLLNQNNMDTNQRARRSVSFRLNNTSGDYNPMNHGCGGYQG